MTDGKIVKEYVDFPLRITVWSNTIMQDGQPKEFLTYKAERISKQEDGTYKNYQSFSGKEIARLWKCLN